MSRKLYQRKFVLNQQRQKIISLWWYGLAFIVSQKWKNKIYKLGKVEDRIAILQLVRSRWF